MAQQISRNTYRITPAPTTASLGATASGSRSEQYRSRYTEEKYKQWDLSLQQSLMEIKDIQARNAAAAEAYSDLRESLIEQIAKKEKLISDLRSDLSTAKEKIAENNKDDDRQRREFNAKQTQTASYQGQSLQLRDEALKLQAGKVARRAAEDNARAKVTAINKGIVEDALSGVGGDIPTASRKLRKTRELGVGQGSEADAIQQSFILVSTAVDTAIRDAAEAAGTPLNEEERDRVRDGVIERLSKSSPDLVMDYETFVDENDTGTGDSGNGYEGNSLGVKPQVVGKDIPTEVDADRQRLIDEAKAEKDALQKELDGLRLRQEKAPNLIRNAQDIQYNTWGPTGFKDDAPGYQQQAALETLGKLFDTAVQNRVSKLPEGTTEEEKSQVAHQTIREMFDFMNTGKKPDRLSKGVAIKPPKTNRTPQDNNGIDGEAALYDDSGESTMPDFTIKPQAKDRVNSMVKIAEAASDKYNSIKDEPALIEQYFSTSSKNGKTTRAARNLYEANQRLGDRGVTFEELFKKVSDYYEGNPETKEEALTALLVYNMIQLKDKK